MYAVLLICGAGGQRGGCARPRVRTVALCLLAVVTVHLGDLVVEPFEKVSAFFNC